MPKVAPPGKPPDPVADAISLLAFARHVIARPCDCTPGCRRLLHGDWEAALLELLTRAENHLRSAA
jgi:hypothetical protein